MSSDSSKATRRRNASKRSAARASAARPKEAGSAKGKRGSAAGDAARRGEKAGKALDRKARKERLTKVVVVLFAALMALSLMLPSLSAILTSSSSSDSPDATSEQDSTGSDAATMAAATTTMETVDSAYSPEMEELKTKLESDQNDLATLLGLADGYLKWGYTASSYATTDDERAHVSELFDLSVGYFDRYLALNDSDAAATDRALALFYKGDVDGAISSLQQRLDSGKGQDYGPLWANLGMMYESSGNEDQAKTCYENAMSADPNDDYGAYSYAQSRLSSLGESTGSSSDATGSTTSSQSLSDALGSASGTGM